MTERYVVVEFNGGPQDGVKAVFEFPPQDEWYFPTLVRRADASASAAESPRDPRHVYRIADEQNFEVVTLSDDELRALLSDKRAMFSAMRDKRAMIFDYQGVRE